MRFLFLLCRKVAVLCLVLGISTATFAQNIKISVGVKAGVPLNDQVNTEYYGFQAQTKPFTVGPVLDVGLPHGFGIELGAMYKRVTQQGEQTIAVGPLYPDRYPDPDPNSEGDPLIYQRSTVSGTGHSWEFPVAGQYHFSLHSTRPYLEAGIVYNQLSNIFESYTGDGQQSPLQFPAVISVPTTSSSNRTGLLLGAGLEFRLEKIRVAPGLRYTRYGTVDSNKISSTNALDFLVGFTF
jgi:opacity protein-like surface antigen